MDSNPNVSMSEWASKIKDMHRQPDPTEEADQKRLEEEIAASRLARQRRSRGLGPGSRTNSLDLSRSKEYSPALQGEDTTSAEAHKPLADRRKGQTDTLNKLMGSTSLPAVTNPPAVTSSNSKPEPMSLAAFMGGRATGPRLNRHAPQQDALDPTQFVQRTRSDAPHPIFGRGGIAMPGMASRSLPPQEPEKPSAPAWSRPGRTPEPRNRRISTPSPEKPESPPISPQRAGVRERTMSTPTGTTALKSSPVPSPQTAHNPSVPQPQMYAAPSKSPVSSASRAFDSRQQASPSSPPHSKSPVVTPSLARPIQPDPRTSLHGPQISASQSPSLAFLRPPTQKDPTPSLSRLKGRGFVQNMVKASSQLGSPTPSPTSQSEKNRPTGGRKSSVLDRWPGSAVSPPPSPSSPSMRRSRTVESPPPMAPSTPKSEPMSKSFSDGGIPKPSDPAPVVGRISGGLGSANTLVEIQPKGFIQPKKIGVDEHGYKRGSDPLPPLSKESAPSEPAKPLIHPTKDRAKKPKKSRGRGQEIVPSTSPPAASYLSNTGATSYITPLSSESSMVDRKPSEGALPPSTVSTQHSAELDLGSSATTHSGGVGSALFGRKALPGMTQSHPAAVSSSQSASKMVSQSDHVSAPRPLPGLATGPSPKFSQSNDTSIVSAPQFSIPSSGNRPTVMEVAQALADPAPNLRPTYSSPIERDDNPSESSSFSTPRPRNVMPTSAQAEKRKSSYDRYSVMLPPLKEEATPDPTPVSTLTRSLGKSFVQPDFDLVNSKLNEGGGATDNPVEVKLQEEPVSEMLHFTHVDEPVPQVDISPLIAESRPPGPRSDSQTIQVDVLQIAGSSALPLGLTNIFYDTEVLAIIYRYKSQSTGLINSTVWSWQGKSGSLGSSEEQKLSELAKRYGTFIVPTKHFSEPMEMVQCLGGTLAIRQGTRTHWANENTAMHIVRSTHDVAFIDQVDIDIKNVCSGFSYCVSILDTLFVWHGCGSPSTERAAALEYGKTLTSSPEDIVVLIENESDDDEMFWMVLGDEAEYAKAYYWKWRPSIKSTPRIWGVEAARKDILSPVQSFHAEESPHTSVYIMDCVFEFFVLIPSGARGKRRDISLALSMATDAATRLASARPYTPTVHVLILPSQLPVDLRVQFRGLEDVFLNDADVPEHMNILPWKDALLHLKTSSWNRSQLRDKSMLPLGLDESHIS